MAAEPNAAERAAARPRLLVATAALLEALYQPEAAGVLATLKPTDMLPGGARVPGTSYELPAATAARAMHDLLALRGGNADALFMALAEADIAARFAAITGKEPPALAGLYVYCAAGIAGETGESFEAALRRLYLACDKVFTVTQMRRVDQQLQDWGRRPDALDVVPVQQFVARFVRNAPP